MAKASGVTRTLQRDRNPNGAPGIYDLYRVGGTKTDSGLSFMSTTFEYADQYTSHLTHAGESTLRYSVQINNPLVVELKNRDVLKENTYFTDAAYKKLVGNKPSKTQLNNDRELAKALVSSKYDAIMYKGADGKVLEVAVSPNKLGKGVKSRESDYFSYTFGQTRKQYIDDMTDVYRSYGNTLENSRKYAIQDANKQQREFKRKRAR